MKLTSALAFATAQAFLAAAGPVQNLQHRQTSCPGVHVFGARETTVSPGFGSSSTVVNKVTQAYSGYVSKFRHPLPTPQTSTAFPSRRTQLELPTLCPMSTQVMDGD